MGHSARCHLPLAQKALDPLSWEQIDVEGLLM
jgi:hypothetical protein